MTSTETFVVAIVGTIVAGIPAIVAAIYGAKNHTKTSNIEAAVTTPPGVEPLGQITSDAADTIEHIHEVVCDDKKPS